MTTDEQWVYSGLNGTGRWYYTRLGRLQSRSMRHEAKGEEELSVLLGGYQGIVEAGVQAKE